MIRENQTFYHQLNILSDGVIVFASFLLGLWARFYLIPGGENNLTLRMQLLTALLLVPLHLFSYAAAGVYEPQRNRRLYMQLARLLWAELADLALLLVCLYLWKDNAFSRLALAFYFAVELSVLWLKRIVLRRALRRLRAKGYNQKKVLLVGCGETVKRCAQEFLQTPELGYQLIGYVAQAEDWKRVPRLGGYDELAEILERTAPDEVVAGLELAEYDRMPAIIRACEDSGTKLALVPCYARYLPARAQIDFLNGIPMMNLRRIPLDNIGKAAIKRTMDVLGALVLIVLSSPVMLAAAIGTKLSSPGPVIFRQERVGRNKKLFQMYKFRSMRVNADSATAWSTDDDPRRTRFGAFLRKYSIDELPQFFNVLKGDMSLVGPRPEIPHYVERFRREIPLYMVKHQVRPGITGWAQVHGLRGNTSIQKRIEYDIFYIENWSLFLDVKILLMTLGKAKNSEKL